MLTGTITYIYVHVGYGQPNHLAIKIKRHRLSFYREPILFINIHWIIPAGRFVDIYYNIAFRSGEDNYNICTICTLIYMQEFVTPCYYEKTGVFPLKVRLKLGGQSFD